MKHALFLSLCLACAREACAEGSAATQTDVHATRESPRAELRQACPQALSELPDALATTAQETAQASTVFVSFEIEGGRLHDLRTEGGTARQARAVRHAVRHLGCSNGHAGRQRLRFQVRFIDPFDRRPQQALAVLDLPGH